MFSVINKAYLAASSRQLQNWGEVVLPPSPFLARWDDGGTNRGSVSVYLDTQVRPRDRSSLDRRPLRA